MTQVIPKIPVGTHQSGRFNFRYTYRIFVPEKTRENTCSQTSHKIYTPLITRGGVVVVQRSKICGRVKLCNSFLTFLNKKLKSITCKLHTLFLKFSTFFHFTQTLEKTAKTRVFTLWFTDFLFYYLDKRTLLSDFGYCHDEECCYL